MSPDDLIALNEEIAGMARAGLPLDQGLAGLAREMHRGRLRLVTAQIAEDLRQGKTLPQALASQGSKVPPFYASLVQAGIRTGRLADVLATLTFYTRSQVELRLTILGALFYPLVVVTIASAIFILACYYILPVFNTIFTDMRMQMPILTVWTLRIGERPIQNLLTPFLLILAAVLITRFVFRMTAHGRLLWAHFLYSVPVIGSLIRSSRLAASTELLAILVDHEVPLPEAFGLAGGASRDPILAMAADQVSEDLNEGQALGTVMRKRRLVPDLIAWMTCWGQQRGHLGKTLHEVADLYKRQAEMRASFLRNVLPPFLILATAGVLVTMFIFTIIMPMYRLLEGLTK